MARRTQTEYSIFTGKSPQILNHDIGWWEDLPLTLEHCWCHIQCVGDNGGDDGREDCHQEQPRLAYREREEEVSVMGLKAAKKAAQLCVRSRLKIFLNNKRDSSKKETKGSHSTTP